MKPLIDLLPFDGSKTYIIGLIVVGLGIWQQNVELISIGLGLLGLRHGLDKK